jgi:acetolactate synthase I/II/III large subunit
VLLKDLSAAAVALVRLGVPRAFTVGTVARALDQTFVQAACAAGLPVAVAPSATAACAMAGIASRLSGVPAAVVLDDRPACPSALVGLSRAFLERSAVLLLVGPSPLHRSLAPPIVKGRVGIGDTIARDPGVGFDGPSAREGPADALDERSGSPASVDAALARAAALAMSDPRGPVLVEIDEVRRNDRSGIGRWLHELAPPPADALDRAARVLGESSRPVVVVGLEAACEADATWVRAFVEATPAPVLATLRGRGAVPDPHPLVLGTLGPGVVEGTVLSRADLVVAVGLDPIELDASLPWSVPVLRIARSRVVAPPWTVATEVLGDIALALEELAPRLRSRQRADWDLAELDRLRQRLVARRLADAGARIVDAARRATEPGTIAAFDAGVGALAGAWQSVSPGELIVLSGPDGRGLGVAAAIAARLARPEHTVLCFTDVPGLRLAVAELDLAVRDEVAIAVIVMNATGESVAPLARSLGVTALAVKGATAVASALGGATAAKRPVLVDVRLDSAGGEGGSP